MSIARALYWQAKVVILDEPTAALAVMEREHVIALARRLAAEGVGVIYIGHNLIEILEVADRVAVMFRGRIVHTAPRRAYQPAGADQIHDRVHRKQSRNRHEAEQV